MVPAFGCQEEVRQQERCGLLLEVYSHDVSVEGGAVFRVVFVEDLT